jgi:hypothetical protein
MIHNKRDTIRERGFHFYITPSHRAVSCNKLTIHSPPYKLMIHSPSRRCLDRRVGLPE